MTNEFEEFDTVSADFLKAFENYLFYHYGMRCSEQQAGCKVCQMWALYDAFKLQIDPSS